MTHADALDAALVDVCASLLARGDHLRARGHGVYDRYEAGEVEEAAAEVITEAVNDDLEWILALVDRIDMLRAEVGMRRAAERLTAP